MKPLLRTVSTIADAQLGATVTVGDWSGQLVGVIPRSNDVRLRIELQGGAELLTGWLHRDTPIEIHRERP